MKRRDNEIVDAYYTQRKALAASCEAYDRGSKWEAARLATSVFMMVHDAGKNHSIVSQCGVGKSNWPWAATGPEINDADMSSVIGSSCLLELDRTQDGNLELIPLCTYQDRHDIPLHFRFPQFDEWWERDIIAFESELSDPLALIDVRPPLLRRGMPSLPRGIPHLIADNMAAAAYRARPQPVLPPIRGQLTRLTRKKLVLALRNQDGGSHFDPELNDPNYSA
jgi:hypothetical protein